jgi:S1-C subfamily serine protease
MSDQRIFVRVRGKTQGPYTVEQLQQLAARGQFSRLHEISTDGVEWKRASSIPELFVDEKPSNSVSRGFFEERAPPSTTDDKFFLRVRGRACGPYAEEQLRSMARKGQFSRLHEISTDGVSWVRASTVPSLFLDRDDRQKSELALTVQPNQPTPPIEPAITISEDDLLVPHSSLSPLAFPAEQPYAAKREESSIPWSWMLLALLIAISIAAAATALIVWRNSESLTLASGDIRSGDRGIINSVEDDASLSNAVAMVICGCRVVLADGAEIEAPRSSGSGFAISPDGYIATNKHVIEEISKLEKATLLLDKIRKEKLIDIQPRVWIFFGQNHKYVAQIVHVSEHHDTAILKINRGTGPYFRLSATSAIGRGQKVFALGFPAAARVALSDEEKVEQLVREVQDGEEAAKTVQSHFKPRDFDFALTTGSVSRVVNESEGRCWIQHNADINPGNSGGPLVSESGVVVGINTGVARQSNGVYFSIAMPQLREELEHHVKSLQWQ